MSPQTAFAQKEAKFPALLQNLGAFFLSRLFRLPVLDQLDAEHQAFATNISDQVMLFLEAIEAGQNVIADPQGVCLEFFAVDDFEHGVALGANHRVSAEGIKMGALGEGRGNFRRGNDCA